MMLRGFIRRLPVQATLFNRQSRFFASAAENAPALGKDAEAGPTPGLSRYVNGELVKRSEIVLKKHEDIEGFVINIVKEYFRTTNKSALKLESSLADHGLDSLDSIEISMRIEEELGYVISAETLPVLLKIKHYVNYIKHVEAYKEKTGKAPLP